MFWEILWGLILGFALSGTVQAVVSKREMSRLLPNACVGTIAKALGLGAASSSCSYAAVALARSVFLKGADFIAAMAFELASTNMVIELGIILWVLMGWRFTLAEFAGAPLMVAILVWLLRRWLSSELLQQARQQAEQGRRGPMEGHAAMDMSVTQGTLLARLRSRAGRTAASQYFVMDWLAIWRDIAGGLLIAGALEAWVPRTAWSHFFLASHPRVAVVWGPIVGPLVAMATFVCSIGNVPLAAVLWRGGSSFGGVIAFLYADLLIIPVLRIYRKYYGARMQWLLLGGMYMAMAITAWVIELVFHALDLLPRTHQAIIAPANITWNYTTWLNIAFLVLAAAMLVRFFQTGGREMAAMMD